MASSAPTDSPTGIAPTARCPKGVGLVFVDLDGTLLVDGGLVRPRVAAALRRAHERGVILAVSSGRPVSMVPASVRDLGVMDYYVCTNGATVYDAALARIAEWCMPADLASGIVWALGPLGASWNAFVDGTGVSELRNTTYMVAHHEWLRPRSPRSLMRLARRGLRLVLGRDGMRQARDIRPTLATAPAVEKLGCSFGSPEAASAAAELLSGAGLEVAAVGPRELELTAPGVDKGAAAAWLARRLGVDAGRAVAFGDSANDASLARSVGCLVAMGNADDALKALASCVCGGVLEDGVATWLEAQMTEADGKVA